MQLSFQVALLIVGTALLLLGVLGRVEIKQIIVGTEIRGARLCVGFIGSVFIILSIFLTLNPLFTHTLPANPEYSQSNQEQVYVQSNYTLDKKLLNDSDVERKPQNELSELRNEIYARHGYRFKEQKWLLYFRRKSWYIPRYSMEVVWGKLNQIEKNNIYFLLEKEKK